MITKNGRQLQTLEDWETFAGPKSTNQWKDGRSAKEAARFWLRSGPETFPPVISDILDSHPDFSVPVSWAAEPEAPVRFDGFGGEPANIDLLVAIEDQQGPALLVVEAKADETFGATVENTLAKAAKRLEVSPRSKGVARVVRLGKKIFGLEPSELDEIAGLRYQLMTATAAAIAESERRHIPRALVLVQEFITDKTDDEHHAANAEDLNSYLNALGCEPVSSGRIVGPLQFDPVTLYFGKVSHQLRGGTLSSKINV